MIFIPRRAALVRRFLVGAAVGWQVTFGALVIAAPARMMGAEQWQPIVDAVSPAVQGVALLTLGLASGVGLLIDRPLWAGLSLIATIAILGLWSLAFTHGAVTGGTGGAQLPNLALMAACLAAAELSLPVRGSNANE